MLKYLYAKEVCSEIPDEISLGVSISGCLIKCSGCHSKELWEDKGVPLTLSMIDALLKKHEGVTCLLLLGGEHDVGYLTKIFQHCHKSIKTAWYCGLSEIPKKSKIINYLDYIKIGPYIQKLGGLSKPKTNQKLYLIEHQSNNKYCLSDITYKFWKHAAE